MHCASAVQLNLKQSYHRNALYKCNTTNYETQSYHRNALYKCNTTNYETQSYYRNALYKCNAIVLLNKALLQGMHPQLMQLLNLKHCFTTTNAMYKCNAIVLLTLLQGMYPQLMQLLNG
jgi:hypothetical protein